MVCDQYGRQIRRAVGSDGQVVRFADTPPEGNKDGDIVPRPQFATHAQTIEALRQERIDWLAYQVYYRSKDGSRQLRSGLTVETAGKLQMKVLQDGGSDVVVVREIACAGWPQLPYEELKKLPELPPTPMSDLIKIRDPEMRKAAMRVRREADEAINKSRELERVE